LKPTHAVTMHGILVLPALAWLLSFASWSERRRLRVVLGAGSGYIAVAGVVAMRNLVGLELRQIPVATIALLALAALSLLLTGFLACRATARCPGFTGRQE
jgi:hypothetical protein